jgi:hypothetical protein
VTAARSSQFGEWRHRFEAKVTNFYANNTNGIERSRRKMKEGKKKPNPFISMSNNILINISYPAYPQPSEILNYLFLCHNLFFYLPIKKSFRSKESFI